METIRRNQKEVWEFKNTVTQIKSDFEKESSIDCKELRKEMVKLKIHLWKLHKEKMNENKKERDVQKLWDNYQRCNMCTREEVSEKGAEENSK